MLLNADNLGENPSSAACQDFIAVDNEHGKRDVAFREQVGSSDIAVNHCLGLGGSLRDPSISFFQNAFCSNGHSYVATGYSAFSGDQAVVRDFDLPRMLDDGKIVFKQTSPRPKPCRQFVLAYSFGANIAIDLAKSNLIDGALLIAPAVKIEDLKRFATHNNDKGHYTFVVPHHTALGEIKARGVRITSEALYRAAQNEVLGSQKETVLNCPVIILGDPQDNRVPFRSMEELRDRILIQRGSTTEHPELISVEGAGHDFRDRVHQELILQQMKRLFGLASLG